MRSPVGPALALHCSCPGALVRHSEVVARRGYAIDDDENEQHTRGIAVPVRDHRGPAIGGVSTQRAR
jgi:DNA-binding IclR family transcriptional regulator